MPADATVVSAETVCLASISWSRSIYQAHDEQVQRRSQGKESVRMYLLAAPFMYMYLLNFQLQARYLVEVVRTQPFLWYLDSPCFYLLRGLCNLPSTFSALVFDLDGYDDVARQARRTACPKHGPGNSGNGSLTFSMSSASRFPSANKSSILLPSARALFRSPNVLHWCPDLIL